MRDRYSHLEPHCAIGTASEDEEAVVAGKKAKTYKTPVTLVSGRGHSGGEAKSVGDQSMKSEGSVSLVSYKDLKDRKMSVDINQMAEQTLKRLTDAPDQKHADELLKKWRSASPGKAPLTTGTFRDLKASTHEKLYQARPDEGSS
jgi:hypothetical protein